MECNFFTNLPIEITTEILSRLPLRSIALRKCVCKPWLNLLNSDDFEFKTPPALALLQQMDSTRCSIFDIEDEDEADEEKSHDLHYIPLTHFDIPNENIDPLAGTAANGLLLLHSKYGHSKIPLIICNPITRQYIELWGPEGYFYDDDDDSGGVEFSIGFGISKLSGQYKVVCINADVGSDSCRHVYTLGTGTWRRVEAGAASDLIFSTSRNIVCNGILHWIGGVNDSCICGFDLENECFSIFSAPPLPVDRRSRLIAELSALRDCLCYSYTWEGEIVIRLMKEYYVEESWTILHKISSNVSNLSWASSYHWNYMFVEPIILFKDGDILMLLDGNQFSYYSNKTRTVQQVGMFKDAAGKGYVRALIFTPSLFSLKNFGFENIMSYYIMFCCYRI